MVRILHCADLHLDAPFSLHTPREAESRKIELRAALSSVTFLIRTQGIQICLISGDLFDSATVTPETRALLERELAACANCRFFIAAGNHDPLGERSPYRAVRWPQNVHIFSPQKECVHLDDCNTDVYGFSFDCTNGNENPLTGYPSLNAERLNLLCVHGELNGSTADGYAPFTRADLAACGFDYVALGHIHKGTGVQYEQGVAWGYPGCIKGRGFDETGEKGVLVGEIAKGDVRLQFRCISEGRYETAVCDVSGCDREQAAERARAVIRTFGPKVSLRLTLEGEVSEGLLLLPEELAGSDTLRTLDLIDHTRLAPNFTALEQSGTLKGVFYRLMREKMQQDPDGIAEDACKYGLLALDERNIADLDLQGF